MSIVLILEFDDIVLMFYIYFVIFSDKLCYLVLFIKCIIGFIFIILSFYDYGILYKYMCYSGFCSYKVLKL